MKGGEYESRDGKKDHHCTLQFLVPVEKKIATSINKISKLNKNTDK